MEDTAEKLCIVEDTIDWHKRTFYDVAFDAFPLDFRSKEGKAFRHKCQYIGNTAKLKRFTLTLAKVVQSTTTETKLISGVVHKLATEPLPTPAELAYLSTIAPVRLSRPVFFCVGGTNTAVCKKKAEQFIFRSYGRMMLNRLLKKHSTAYHRLFCSRTLTANSVPTRLT